MPSSRSRVLLAAALLVGVATASSAQFLQRRKQPDIGDRVQVSPTPLDDFDYQLRLTDRAINRIFESFTAYQQRRKAERGNDEATLKRFEARVRGGKLELEGEADAPIVGEVRFHLVGVLELGEPDRFDFVLDEVEVTSKSTLKTLTLKLTKQVLLSIFGIFVKAGKLNDFVEISTNWAFNVPIVGPILGNRTIFIRLKDKALPILDHFHTVHLSRTRDGMITLQGLLRDRP
jgi:hypothetical protein